jgi:hypothetical protein
MKENGNKQIYDICVTDPGSLFCMPMLLASKDVSGGVGCEGHTPFPCSNVLISTVFLPNSENHQHY